MNEIDDVSHPSLRNVMNGYRKMRRHAEVLETECAHMRNRIMLLEQIVEALGDDNRLYASQELGYAATEIEALAHYHRCRGAELFNRERLNSRVWRRHAKRAS